MDASEIIHNTNSASTGNIKDSKSLPQRKPEKAFGDEGSKRTHLGTKCRRPVRSSFSPTSGLKEEEEESKGHPAEDVTEKEGNIQVENGSIILTTPAYLLDIDDPNYSCNYARWKVGVGPMDVYNTGRKYDVPEDYVFFPWPASPTATPPVLEYHGPGDEKWAVNWLRFTVGLQPL
jgi:hypothetical protein